MQVTAGLVEKAERRLLILLLQVQVTARQVELMSAQLKVERRLLIFPVLCIPANHLFVERHMKTQVRTEHQSPQIDRVVWN